MPGLARGVLDEAVLAGVGPHPGLRLGVQVEVRREADPWHADRSRDRHPFAAAREDVVRVQIFEFGAGRTTTALIVPWFFMSLVGLGGLVAATW